MGGSLLAIPRRPTDNLNTINPGFFTGFSDAEGCFTFSVLRNKELKLGWVIKFKFQINLHQKDRIILEQIIKYFEMGP